MGNRSRILLTSPYWDTQNSRNIELLDLYTSRLTRGQGIFTQAGYCPYTALHLLAQNIDLPATVLEYPTEEIFLREIRRGYDWVGITLSAIDTANVIKMCTQIRELSPRSHIVVGGCGVPALRENLDSDAGLVDFICDGEGVSYLRSLLGEPEARRLCQKLPPAAGGIPWLFYNVQAANIVAGLGCSHGCFFCSTSHFYRGHIDMADAQELFQYLKERWREYPRLRTAMIFDEDFFKDKDKVMKLGELIRSDKEFGLRKLNYLSFGSLSSLEQYTPEELALSGVSFIWIGVESLYAKLRKLGNRHTQQTFDSLHHHGIGTVGSWILGWEDQTHENIGADLESFIQLAPTFAQISILTPMPGTPLWENLKKHKELKPDFDWSRAHLYALNFRHPYMDERTLLDLADRGYNELNARYGPTVLRDFWVHLEGLRFCLSSQNQFLSGDKAACHRQALLESFSVLKAVATVSCEPSIQESALAAIEEYQQLVGKVDWRLKLTQSFVLLKAQKVQKSGNEPHTRIPLTMKYQYNQGKMKLTYPGKPWLRLLKPLYSVFEGFVYRLFKSAARTNGLIVEDKEQVC